MNALVVAISLAIGTFSFAQDQNTFSNTLNPFTTDGCSVIPDGSIRQCCIRHDLNYWHGGTREERRQADLELKECAKVTKGVHVPAILVYAGVRLGGGPKNQTSFRWGYGWTYMRPYGQLTESELEQIDSLVPEDPLLIPVTRPKSHPKPLPAYSGNYCLDEAALALKEHGIDLDNLDEESWKAFYKRSKVILSVRDNRNLEYQINFGRIQLEDCRRPIYTQERRNKIHGKLIKTPQGESL